MQKFITYRTTSFDSASVNSHPLVADRIVWDKAKKTNKPFIARHGQLNPIWDFSKVLKQVIDLVVKISRTPNIFCALFSMKIS